MTIISLNQGYIHKPMAVTEGGSGNSSLTAYSLLAAADVDATLAIQSLGTGTTGQLPKSAGANDPATLVNENVSGCWQLLSTQVASNSATIEFTNLSSNYSMFKLFLSNVIPASNGSFRMRVSTDNGSTWDQGSTDYRFALNSYDENNSFATINGNPSSIRIDNTQLSSTSQGNFFEFTIMRPSIVDYFNGMFFIGRYLDVTGANQRLIIGSGSRQTTQDVDGIQFFSGTGNIASGTFKLYGVLL